MKAELTSSDMRRNIALIGSIPNNVIKQVGNNLRHNTQTTHFEDLCILFRDKKKLRDADADFHLLVLCLKDCCLGPDTLAFTSNRC